MSKIDANVENGWRAVALATEVTSEKPLGCFLDGAPIVLFRDATGAAHALEDRCPHRRVPLSMGRMRPDGMLQCGYHGWTFEGATGQCRRIPNLRPDEPISPRYRVPTYQLAEAGGFVFVAPEPGAALPEAPTLGAAAHQGHVTVATEYGAYLAALLDGPQLLVSFPGIRISDYTYGDFQSKGDVVVSERGCIWPGPKARDPFLTDYPLSLRVTLDARTGFATLTMLDGAAKAVARACLAISPVARGATSVRWRAEGQDIPGGIFSLRWRMDRARNKSPFAVHAAVDGAALSTLMLGPSQALQAQSAETTARLHTAA